MEKTGTEEREHLNVWVDGWVIKALDERAAHADRSRSAEVRRVLAEHLKPKEGEPPFVVAR